MAQQYPSGVGGNPIVSFQCPKNRLTQVALCWYMTEYSIFRKEPSCCQRIEAAHAAGKTQRQPHPLQPCLSGSPQEKNPAVWSPVTTLRTQCQLLICSHGSLFPTYSVRLLQDTCLGLSNSRGSKQNAQKHLWKEATV